MAHVSSRSGETVKVDMSPSNCDKIEKLLTEGEEVLKICKDCGVECDDEIKKIASLRKLYQKLCAIHKRDGRL